MMYPGLFKARYPVLKGKDWVRTIDPEDRAVFVSIGAEAHLHGYLGGLSLLKKKGREHLSKIGRIGAIASNSKRAWDKAVREENYKVLGVMY